MADDKDENWAAEDETAARFWFGEIERAEKAFRPWHDTCDTIAKRYKDERDKSRQGVRKFNVLWSMLQTMKPAVYAGAPKPVIERRFLEANDTERTAGIALQRATSVEIETGDFDEAVGGDQQGAMIDYLLFSRGQVRVRYEAEIEEKEDAVEQGEDDDEAQEEQEQEETSLPVVTSERLCIDYIHRKDYLHDPARTWQEVRWNAFRSWLTKSQVRKKFGEEIADKAEYKDMAERDAMVERMSGKYTPSEKRAEFWEIWDKPRRMVWMICVGLEDRICKKEPDPLELKKFWPCPKPLYGTLTNDSLVPVPDYVEYRDQAEELDELSQRIAKITAAIQVRGFYDASQPELAQLLQSGTENKLIPYEGWATLMDKGGLEKAIALLPVELLVKTLQTLTQVFDQRKELLYEVTGIADIIRGNSSPEETYGAQKIKGQFATLRLKDRQKSVAKFCREIVRIMVELIAFHFSPETIAAMTGVAEPNSPDAQYFQQAMQLVSDARMRSFRVDIETDSTIALDEQSEKEARTEFLNAVAQFMSGVLPVGEKMPMLLPVMGQMLLFGVRGFRVGRELESSFEQTINRLGQMAQQMQSQGPPPDPKMLEAQSKQQDMQERLKLEQMKTQNTQKMEEDRLQFEQVQHRDDLQLEQQKFHQQMTLDEVKHSRELVVQHHANQQQAAQSAATATVKGEDGTARPAPKPEPVEPHPALEHIMQRAAGGGGPPTSAPQQDHTLAALHELGNSVAMLHKAFAQMMAMHAAPTEVVRDPHTNRVVGTRKVMPSMH